MLLFRCLGWGESVVVQVVMIGRGLLLFRLSGWREDCCCSGCQDGERSVVVQVVKMERSLLLFGL